MGSATEIVSATFQDNGTIFQEQDASLQTDGILSKYLSGISTTQVMITILLGLVAYDQSQLDSATVS